MVCHGAGQYQKGCGDGGGVSGRVCGKLGVEWVEMALVGVRVVGGALGGVAGALGAVAGSWGGLCIGFVAGAGTLAGGGCEGGLGMGFTGADLPREDGLAPWAGVAWRVAGRPTKPAHCGCLRIHIHIHIHV